MQVLVNLSTEGEMDNTVHENQGTLKRIEPVVGLRVICKEDLFSDHRGRVIPAGTDNLIISEIFGQHVHLQWPDGKRAANNVHISKLYTRSLEIKMATQPEAIEMQVTVTPEAEAWLDKLSETLAQFTLDQGTPEHTEQGPKEQVDCLISFWENQAKIWKQEYDDIYTPARRDALTALLQPIDYTGSDEKVYKHLLAARCVRLELVYPFLSTLEQKRVDHWREIQTYKLEKG
jgi:hypothetical protein